MESLGAADLAQQIIDAETNIFLNRIVIDDDAATINVIQKKDGSLLSNDIFIASKLANFNHYTKILGDYIY